MKKLTILIITMSIYLISFSQNTVLPPGFILEELSSDLSFPTDLVVAPDGRIFIAEKTGSIRIFENGILLPEPFYTVETQTPDERGLSGIILDPNFANNGYVYLYYTIPNESRNKIARITSAGNTALPNSEIELMRFDVMWASWHNGGGMAFDTSGKLIIGIGDGTAWQTAKLMSTTLGKILRINTDGSIPTDNPFYNINTGLNRAISAYGIRNPYTMATSKAGQIYFNDVGGDAYEEVNEYIFGKNYGWGDVEGPLGANPPPDTNYVDPIHYYNHDTGCAIVGGAFYEPDFQQFPPYYSGKYFFMDYCEGKIWCMDTSTYEVTTFASEDLESINNITVSNDGSLYIIRVASGKLLRISYVGINSPPFITVQPKSKIVAVNDSVVFKVQASGDSLSYTWVYNGAVIQNGAIDSISLNNLQLSNDQDSLYVQVFNPYGMTVSNTVKLSVVNGTPPVLKGLNVTETYSAGDTITYSGWATDLDQSTIPLNNYTWWVNFHHDEHTHPAIANTSGIDSGFYIVPLFGETDTNVFYRVHLEVTDSSGLKSQKSIDVLPQKVIMKLHTDPQGLEVNVDGSNELTPYNLKSVHNMKRTISFPSYYIKSNDIYEFEKWKEDNTSDTLSRIFSAKDTTITGVYSFVSPYCYGFGTGGSLKVYQDTGSSQVFYKEQVVDKIKENWSIRNPYPWDDPAFPLDYWSAKWYGYLTAPVTGSYTFYLEHDSRVSFRLDSNVLLNKSVTTNDLQEDTFTVNLVGGQPYEYALDYDHYLHIARVSLSWSFSVIPKHEIPLQQMDLEAFYRSKDPVNLIILFPNPNETDKLFIRVKNEHISKNIEVKIYGNMGRLMNTFQGVVQSTIVEVPIHDLSSGIYFLEISIIGAGVQEAHKLIRY